MSVIRITCGGFSSEPPEQAVMADRRNPVTRIEGDWPWLAEDKRRRRRAEGSGRCIGPGGAPYGPGVEAWVRTRGRSRLNDRRGRPIWSTLRSPGGGVLVPGALAVDALQEDDQSGVGDRYLQVRRGALGLRDVRTLRDHLTRSSENRTE